MVQFNFFLLLHKWRSLHSGKLYVVRVGKNLKTLLNVKNLYAKLILTLTGLIQQIFK